MSDFMTERLTEDAGEEFAPSRYGLKSKNDAIVSPYRTYDLFFEITFHVLQKLGVYEDIGTPEECRKAMEHMEDKQSQKYVQESAVAKIIKDLYEKYDNSAYDPDYASAIEDFEEKLHAIVAQQEPEE